MLLKQKIIFVVQLLSYLALIPMFMYSNLNEWMITIAIYCLLFGIGISLSYHRNITHKMLNIKFEKFFAVVGCLCFQGGPLGWALLHRTHHAYTDTEKDPHSPIHGFIHSWFFPSLWIPTKKDMRRVVDLARNEYLVWLEKDRIYFSIHIFTVVILYFLDPYSLIYAYLVPICFTWMAVGATNIFGHGLGYKNIPVKNLSTNVPILGTILLGEGFHNNHHCEPKNYNFSKKWYEIDPIYWICKLVKV